MTENEKKPASEHELAIGLLDLGLNYSKDASKLNEGIKMIKNGLTMLGDDVPFEYCYEIGLLLNNVKDESGVRVPEFQEEAIRLLEKAVADSAGIEKLEQTAGAQAVTMLNSMLDSAKGEYEARKKINVYEKSDEEKIFAEKVATTVAVTFCQGCGGKLPSLDAFCTMCGRGPQSEIPTTQKSAEINSSAASSNFFIILALCVAVGVLFFFSWAELDYEELRVTEILSEIWDDARDTADWRSRWDDTNHPAFVYFLENGGGFFLSLLIIPLMCAIAVIKLLLNRDGDEKKFGNAYASALSAAIVSAAVGIFFAGLLNIILREYSRSWGDSGSLSITAYALCGAALVCAFIIANNILGKENSAKSFLFSGGVILLIFGLLNLLPISAWIYLLRDFDEFIDMLSDDTDFMINFLVGVATSVWLLAAGLLFMKNKNEIRNAGGIKSFAIATFVVVGISAVYNIGIIPRDETSALGVFFGIDGGEFNSAVTLFMAIIIAANILCYIGASINENKKNSGGI
jgi:hypothetical protein